MAMINCKECGQEVSNKATACPNCGAPIKKKSVGASIARIILMLAALLLPIPMLFIAGPIVAVLTFVVLFILALFLK